MKWAIASAIAVIAVTAVFGQPAPPTSHEYANVNGQRLHYAKAGSGPLIVFLHGFPEFWYEWKHQIAEFSRDRTVVAPDMRGYNLSSKPAELSAYQMPNLVEDVRTLASELIKSTGGTTFTLVAHDWGGVVAWVFAALHPEMLDKLVIVNAPHPTIFGKLLSSDAAQQKASTYMLMFRSPEAEATLSANSYEWLTSAVLGDGIKDGTVTEADRKAYIEAWSQPGALTGMIDYYRYSVFTPPWRAWNAIRTVTAPTLVIWGGRDRYLGPKLAEPERHDVPNLDRVVRLPNASHWVHHDEADRVNELLVDFFTPAVEA